MTIHEIYNERKEQYLKYSAEIKVYNTQMQQLVTQLLENIETMRTATNAIQNDEIRTGLNAVLDKLEHAPSLADDDALLKECYDKLEELAALLEQDIRRALND